MAGKDERPPPPAAAILPPPKPSDRETVDRGIRLGFIFTAVYIPALYFFIPLPMPNLPTVTDRMVFTLRLQTLSVMTLLAGLVLVMGTRKASRAIDPLGGKAEHLLAVNLRYNANTLEQLVLSVVGQLVMTTYLSESQMKIVPVLVSLFVVARAAFYIGYTIRPVKRAFGFCCTFAPTMGVWAFVLFNLFSNFVSLVANN